MASRQEQRAKEEKAEVAARYAADELKHVREKRDGAAAVIVKVSDEERAGVIGSLLKSVQGTLEHAKEAVVRKGSETVDVTRERMGAYDDDYTSLQKAEETKDATAEKTGEYKCYTIQKAEETKDYTADKAKQAKDATVEKVREYKDYAVDKAKEAKDTTMHKAGEMKDYTAEKATEGVNYTADKAKQGKDYTVEKAVEGKDYTVEKAADGKAATVSTVMGLKDTAAGAARRAMDFLTGKKDEAKVKTYEPAEHSKEVLKGTEDEARRKMEEMTLKDREFNEEAEREKAIADAQREAAATRGTAAHGNIFSALGSVTESIKHKFTQPTDVVDQTRAARERGGAGRIRVEMDVEHTPAGKVASTLRAADQVSGQTFNAPGEMRDEGAVRAEVDPVTGERKVMK